MTVGSGAVSGEDGLKRRRRLADSGCCRFVFALVTSNCGWREAYFVSTRETQH